MYRVRGSGNLRNLKDNPLVGDIVEFEKDKMLTKIYPRKNSLIRPKVANVDQAIVVFSTIKPDFSHKLLTRYLASIESVNIKPIIIFTK
jgi:ribosome biogenesis GTPase